MALKPNTDFANYYESARFDLTWRINLFLALVLPFLCVSLYVFGQRPYMPTVIGWVATLIVMIIMRVTKTYKLASIFFTLMGCTLCCYTLLFFPNEFHFVDPMWMIICVLYTYFTLGKLWGNIILTLCGTSLILFVLLLLNQNLESTKVLSQGQLISLAVNAGICCLIIANLVYQFLKTTQFAEQSYIAMNIELTDKNAEVHSQNEEKTVMLREIHHRVKNNLQVITSLLRLQAREARDARTIDLFKDSTNRVVAMALIHDKMYQTKDLAKINLEEYLRTLLSDLIDSYAVEIPIKADISSNVETISNKSLVPLALLFNELVSNSLKHAFSSKDEGLIKISVDREKDKIVLSYWDNGVWRNKQKDTSFGLELIESLTEQMDGVYTRSTKLGTSYEFILPDNL